MQEICTMLQKAIWSIYTSFPTQSDSWGPIWSPNASSDAQHGLASMAQDLQNILIPAAKQLKPRQKTAKLRWCYATKSPPRSLLLGKLGQAAAAPGARLFRKLQNSKYPSHSKWNWNFSSLCLGFPPVILATERTYTTTSLPHVFNKRIVNLIPLQWSHNTQME